MFITNADHLAGFKDIEVTRKDESKVTLRIQALSRQQTRELPILLKQPGANWLDVVSLLCLGEEQVKELTHLEPAQADLVECTCLEMVYGTGFIKRLKANGEAKEKAANPPKPVTMG